MPLRQNESSKQGTSAFKNLQTFIKENKNLSEERRLLLMKASNYYQNLFLKRQLKGHHEWIYLMNSIINEHRKVRTGYNTF